MSTNFQCEYCNHYYASRNAYAQHVGRCIKTVICSSTEESGEDVSSMVSSIPAAQIQNPNVEIPNAEIPNPKSQITISIFCRNPKSQIPNTSNLCILAS
ncbi:hypothetical protein Glove_213g15 [Diversispora epigaea]|uniref:C2H2-type domain-containing protein n=1 Tax=Diversispora epigaea TaxID=1348612 RepID=A0A397IS74_9GLOM|nr:hypothetical protein Glove_213g15 [Diversispora epigaea]